jgi:tetratricopeptide (TPR) repeat protein
MNNLANSYEAAGRRDEALKLREERLALCRKVLGPKHPDTLTAVDSLANSYFAVGRKEEAIALLANDWEAVPNDAGASLSLAIAQLWFGQETNYEATRRRVVQLAEGTDQAGTAERAAKVYCLRPSSSAALLAKALKLANQAMELGKEDSGLQWRQLTLGLAEYRNSQYALAERTMSAVEETDGDHDGPDDSRETARLFRAMSLFKQDKLEEARKVFSQAEAIMPPLPKDENRPIIEGKSFGRDWIVMWLAYKEAKELMEGRPPEAKR